MDEEIFITKNIIETQLVASKFVDKIENGGFIAFYGNLGSGKTTFIQGLAKALGVKRRIISPTFIILRTYKIDRRKVKNLYHIDLYRTTSEHDLLGIGLDQLIKEDNSIIALEWAEKMGNLMPSKRYEVHITNLSDDKREIKIKHYE